MAPTDQIFLLLYITSFSCKASVNFTLLYDISFLCLAYVSCLKAVTVSLVILRLFVFNYVCIKLMPCDFTASEHEMASPKSLQTNTALKDIPPQLDDLLRAVAGELETVELESVVKSIKNTLKGTFEMQHDHDLYSCLLLFANQGLLSGENLTLLERFVAPKASKKGKIQQRIETFKRSRLQVGFA